jgi:hypothetical protein
MIEDNNHQNIQRMLLKVDVEGAEWDALETASSELLSRFSQIVIELHGLTVTPTEQNTCRMQQVLQKILITHQPVHVHGNCFGPALILPGLVLPWAVEVTFVSRRVYGPRLKAKSICFPTILDASNRLERFDLLLGNLGQPNEEENKPAHKILS